MQGAKLIQQVKRKQKKMTGVLRKLMVVFGVFFVLLGIMISQAFMLAGFLLVALYFVFDVLSRKEYEYILDGKTLTIDVIYGKRYRKTGSKRTANPFQLPRFLFVTCMSHRYEGGGFMFCPPATDNDGVLDLCCVGNISKVLVLLALPTAFFGKHYFVKGIDAYTATQMSITASAPLWVHTDGEVTRKSCGFRVECLPGAIRMITPEVK